MESNYFELVDYIVTLRKEEIESRTKKLERILKNTPKETHGIIFAPFGKVIVNSDLKNNYKEMNLIRRLPEKFRIVEIEEAECYKEPIIEPPSNEEFYNKY